MNKDAIADIVRALQMALDDAAKHAPDSEPRLIHVGLETWDHKAGRGHRFAYVVQPTGWRQP